jgi:hypothetical protein
MQKIANSRYQPYNSTSALQSYTGTPDSWQELFKVSSKPLKGVVYTGRYSHLQQIYQSMLALRMLKTTLPVEVWVSKHDMKYCNAMLSLSTNVPDIVLSHNAVCRQLPDIVGVYSYKFYALLSTAFSDVVYLDADNIPLRNIEEIFESSEYRRTGAILWPDRCGARCLGVIADNGYSAFPNHVLYVANIGGLIYDANNRRYTQEVESGQLALNMRRHGPIVEFGRQLMEDMNFFSRTVRGDKDIWRLAFLMAGEEFHFVDQPIGVSYSLRGRQRDCLAQYFGDDTLNPIFCHQAKIRDPDSLATILRVPEKVRKDKSYCSSLRVLHDEVTLFDEDPTLETRKSLKSLLSTYNASFSEVSRPKMKAVLLNSGVVLVPESKFKSGNPNAANASLRRLAVLKANAVLNTSAVGTLPINFSLAENNTVKSRSSNSTVYQSLRKPMRLPKSQTFRVRPALGKSEIKRRTVAKVDGIYSSVKNIPSYKDPSPLVLEKAPNALKIGHFLGQVYSTTDEAWFVMDHKSEFLLFWESFNTRFALVFRSLFNV